MGSLVLLDRRADGVAVVTLNNPKVNALSQALLAELREVALELTANPAGAVVITGGERIFAAGADISEFKSVFRARGRNVFGRVTRCVCRRVGNTHSDKGADEQRSRGGKPDVALRQKRAPSRERMLAQK